MDQEAPKKSWKPAIIINVLAFMLTLAVACGVGAAGYNSESAGVSAAYPASFILGGAWAGGVGVLIGTAALKGNMKFAPMAGCGCLGSVGMMTFVMFFFAAIWPSL